MNTTRFTILGPRVNGSVAAQFRSPRKLAPMRNAQIEQWEGEGGLATPSEPEETRGRISAELR